MATEKQIKAKEAKEEREAKEKKRLEKIKKTGIAGKVKPMEPKKYNDYGRSGKENPKKRNDMSYKGDPILNKYLYRGKGYDFSDITKEDKEYLDNKKRDSFLAKGGEVKKYKHGGSVNKNTMATTKGWGASRKT